MSILPEKFSVPKGVAIATDRDHANHIGDQLCEFLPDCWPAHAAFGMWRDTTSQQISYLVMVVPVADQNIHMLGATDPASFRRQLTRGVMSLGGAKCMWLVGLTPTLSAIFDSTINSICARSWAASTLNDAHAKGSA